MKLTAQLHYRVDDSKRKLVMDHKVLRNNKHHGLILGDSRGLMGIDPDKVFEGKAVQRVMNFSFTYQTLNIDYLRLARKRCHEDCFLIVGVTPLMLFDYNKHTYPRELLNIKTEDWLEKAYLGRMKNIFISFDEYKKYSKVKFLTKRVVHKNGFIEVFEAPENVMSTLNDYKQHVGKVIKKKYPPLNDIILNMLEENFKKEKVIIFPMKGSPAVQQYEQPLIDNFTNFLESSRSKGFTVIENGLNLDKYFYDGDHLNSKGSTILSQFLNRQLRELSSAKGL